MNIKCKYSKEIEESLHKIDETIMLIRRQAFFARNSIYGMYPNTENIKKLMNLEDERLKSLYELRARIIEESNPKLIIELDKMKEGKNNV